MNMWSFFSHVSAKEANPAPEGEKENVPTHVLPFESVSGNDPDDKGINSSSSVQNLVVDESKLPISVTEHDDLFVYFLRKFYFPFLMKYHKFVAGGWLVVFVICIIYGPKFLSLTRSNLDLPKNAPSTVAIDAFISNYPDASSWPPIFIVAHARSGSVVNSFTQQLAVSVHNFASSESTIASVMGYWEFISIPELKLLAENALSADNRTMVTTVNFVKSTTLNMIDATVKKLLEFANSHSTSDVTVGCTGQFALFTEMTDATTKNFELIDATVLPIAILILGFRVQSYRHMGVALINLICALLLAFAILVPVTKKVAINPFAPSIMMSLGIAICFDYSLFMLTRFREEMDAGKSKEDSVFSCLAQAGHVVALSGTTLFFTFALLVAFPQNFLQSVGYGCGAVVLTAMFANLTITPSLLLSFECLSRFDLCPSAKSCCCYIADDVDPQSRPTCCEMNAKVVSSAEEAKDQDAVLDVAVTAKSTDGTVPTTGEKPSITTTVRNWMDSTWASALSMTVLKGCPRGFWFVVSYLSTEYAVQIILLSFCVTAPFLWKFITFIPTSDDNLIYLQDSTSLNTLHVMQQSFPLGSLDPYSIIVDTNQPNSILTPGYFEFENALIHDVFASEAPKYMDANSVTALSFFEGQDISFETSMSYFNVSSPAFSSSIAGAYRVLAGGLMNTDKSSTLIQIQTIVNPNSQVIVKFINSVRKLLISYTDSNKLYGATVGAYLFGAYTSTLDVQNILYKLVPLMIGLTVGIVLLFVTAAFGSIPLALRLAFTVFTSLAWTYGLMVRIL